jgi:hypothetical protein
VKTDDLLPLSSPDFPSVEDFCENGQKKGTSGKGKECDRWNDLRDVSQMPPDLFPFFPRPLFVCVPNLHKKLHQPLDRKDFHQDGLLVNNDQPFEILFDQWPFTHDAIFSEFTFLRPGDSLETLISNPLFSQT